MGSHRSSAQDPFAFHPECVEIADARPTRNFAVRDSKRPTGPALTFTSHPARPATNTQTPDAILLPPGPATGPA
ncbi:DUF397 domain-containing protein [Streptomyces sp. NPDC090112]|uniref:DUF397 domain-containing protein n=1 Tax=Streptomyces sp. NPDC090112 TaxID=3365949 RepID=UPI0038110024